MKKFTTFFTLLLVVISANAQMSGSLRELPILYVNDELTLHFRSPEAINYVDISSKKMVGDIPVENLARVKPVFGEADSLRTDFYDYEDLGIVTIVGQSFMSQYRIVYTHRLDYVSSEVEILPHNMKPLKFPTVSLTTYELMELSLKIQRQNKKLKNVVSKALGLSARLNNIYTFGDYVFLDITFKNKTNLKYDIDLISFSIDDKKIYKQTNNQSIEVKPVYSLYKMPEFKRSHRNIYVFEKFTFPNSKVLRIRMAENQISGRSLDLLVDYRDLLNADTF